MKNQVIKNKTRIDKQKEKNQHNQLHSARKKGLWPQVVRKIVQIGARAQQEKLYLHKTTTARALKYAT